MFLASLLRRRHEARVAAEQERILRRIQEELAAERLEQAFDLAENLLDLRPSAASYEALLCPIDRSANGGDTPRLYDLLQRLETDLSPTHQAWRLLLRVSLLERLEFHEESCNLAAQFKHLPERYAWMRYNRGTMIMNRFWAYAEAQEEIEATRRAAPDYWQAAGTLAECVLCQGRHAEALAIMDDCVAELRASGRAEEAEIATAWRAELRLWTGDYSGALADLNAAAAEKRPFALGWHGAAQLLLGDAAGALPSLDEAVRLTPADFEVHVWRGEAHEALGDWDGAFSDFDRAARLVGMPVWPLVGRALVNLRRGDTSAAMRDFKALPRRVTAFFQWKAGLRVDADAANAAEVLHCMRREARGLRRSERYLDVVWMKRSRAE